MWQAGPPPPSQRLHIKRNAKPGTAACGTNDKLASVGNKKPIPISPVGLNYVLLKWVRVSKLPKDIMPKIG